MILPEVDDPSTVPAGTVTHDTLGTGPKVDVVVQVKVYEDGNVSIAGTAMPLAIRVIVALMDWALAMVKEETPLNTYSGVEREGGEGEERRGRRGGGGRRGREGKGRMRCSIQGCRRPTHLLLVGRSLCLSIDTSLQTLREKVPLLTMLI